MIRFLYIFLLRLHPPYFKERFGDEMLWIFDQTAGTQALCKLLLDGLLSLIRQWTRRPRFWKEPLVATAAQPGSDGVPYFHTLESSLPRTGALLQGVVLAFAVFTTLGLGINYSRGRISRARLAASRYAGSFRSVAYTNAPQPLAGAGGQQMGWNTAGDELSELWADFKQLTGWSKPAPPAEPTLPATVPAFELGQWLAAFNSGSQKELRVFETENFDKALTSPNGLSRRSSGPLDIGKVEASDAGEIVVLAHARDGSWWRLALQIAAQAPARIAQFTAVKLETASTDRTASVALKPATVAADTLRSYVGTYVPESSSGTTVSITSDGTTISMEAGGQKERLFPVSQTQFLRTARAAEWIEFTKRGDSGFPQLHVFQGTQEYVANRVAVGDEIIDALIAQFDRSDVVALGEWHGSREDASLRSRLIHHPDFPKKARNIVVECGNSLYQGILDLYIRGGNVNRQDLVKVWRNTTQSAAAGNASAPCEQFLSEVRSVNRGLADSSKIRVLAADPPIDWTKVHTRDEFLPFLQRRDSDPAELIAREVLGKGQKALLIYGAGHLWRRTQITGNRGEAIPMPPNIATLLDARFPGRLYTVIRLSGVYPSTEKIEGLIGISSRPVLLTLKGTVFGKLDANEFIGRDIPVRLFPLGLGIGEVATACVYQGKTGESSAIPEESPEGDPAYAAERQRRMRLASSSRR